MMVRAAWFLATLLLVAPAAGASDPPVPADPPEEPDSWRAEVSFAALPGQERDVVCFRGSDCQTPARSFLAGALRGAFESPERWAAALTLSLASLRDQEKVPTDGFRVATLRADLQVELSRGPRAFGAALRVSPVLVVGWANDGTHVRSDFPGIAALIGRTDIWGEVGVPSWPIPTDPRFFYLTGHWVQPLFHVEAGFATFASPAWARGEVDRTGLGPGLWASGRARLTPDSPWEATLSLALAETSSLALGVAYRFRAAD